MSVQSATSPSTPPASAPPVPPPSPAKSWLTKRNIVIGVVLLFLLLVAAGSVAPRQAAITTTITVTTGGMASTEYVTIMQTVTAQPTSAQTAGQGEWKTIKTFTGSGDRDTENFNVPTSYWRIVYTIEAENEQYAGFSAYIYPSGETASYVASVDFDKSGTETSYVRAGPGDFYISVLAANLRSWTIEVQIQQ